LGGFGPLLGLKVFCCSGNHIERVASVVNYQKWQLSGGFIWICLQMIGSSGSIGFGIWHFFVAGMWKWYSYIHPTATELIVAVRAINVFFSLSLVLFGVLNLLFIFGCNANRYSIIALLAATCILWLSRCTKSRIV
jgi:hypothetical protein